MPGAPPPGLRAVRMPQGAIEVVVFSYPISTNDEAARLTAAELSVARLLLAGHSNAEIAGLRGTSLRTVSKQVDAVYKKLGVHSRSELASRLG